MDEEPGHDETAMSEHVGDAISEDVETSSSLLGHFYRGEMDRVTEWRSRLDQTTNWAVTIMAAILTWVFSSQDSPHYLLLIGMVTIVVFLAIDTRRYRAYDVWRARTRIFEQDVIAPVLDPSSTQAHDEWRGELAADLRRPTFKVPLFEAVSRRLRRIYLPLLAIVLSAWVARVTVFAPDEHVFETAAIYVVPGWVVVSVVAGSFAVALAVAFWPIDRQAKGELYEREKAGKWKDDKLEGGGDESSDE